MMTRNKLIKRTVSKWADGVGIVAMASQQKLSYMLIAALREFHEIPEWREAEKAVKDGNPTPLDEFVYHNEPIGKEGVEFREQLEELINYLCGGDFPIVKPSKSLKINL